MPNMGIGNKIQTHGFYRGRLKKECVTLRSPSGEGPVTSHHWPQAGCGASSDQGNPAEGTLREVRDLCDLGAPRPPSSGEARASNLKDKLYRGGKPPAASPAPRLWRPPLLRPQARQRGHLRGAQSHVTCRMHATG